MASVERELEGTLKRITSHIDLESRKAIANTHAALIREVGGPLREVRKCRVVIQSHMQNVHRSKVMPVPGASGVPSEGAPMRVVLSLWCRTLTAVVLLTSEKADWWINRIIICSFVENNR